MRGGGERTIIFIAFLLIIIFINSSEGADNDEEGISVIFNFIFGD